MLATMTSKGQLTVPKPIRDRLGLDTGTKLEFVLDDDGTIRVRALTADPLVASRLLPPPPRRGPVTDAQIDAAIRGRAAARLRRGAK